MDVILLLAKWHNNCVIILDNLKQIKLDRYKVKQTGELTKQLETIINQQNWIKLLHKRNILLK